MAGVSSLDLSGQWRGIFSYAGLLTTYEFIAEISDVSGKLSGQTTEYGEIWQAALAKLMATIDGSRSGNIVAFIKRYHTSDPDYRSPVAYQGTLAEDGNEISGAWFISPDFSGPFVMVRSAGLLVQSEEQIAAPVR